MGLRSLKYADPLQKKVKRNFVQGWSTNMFSENSVENCRASGESWRFTTRLSAETDEGLQEVAQNYLTSQKVA